MSTDTQQQIDWSKVNVRDIPLELAVERIEKEVNTLGINMDFRTLLKRWHPTLIMNLLREVCEGAKMRCRYPNGEYDGRVGSSVVAFLENGHVAHI